MNQDTINISRQYYDKLRACEIAMSKKEPMYLYNIMNAHHCLVYGFGDEATNKLQEEINQLNIEINGMRKRLNEKGTRVESLEKEIHELLKNPPRKSFLNLFK